jgi:MFS family permease
VFAFTAQIAVWGIFFAEKYDHGTLELGFLNMGASIINICGQLFVFTSLNRRVGGFVCGVGGAILFSISLFLMSLPDSSHTGVYFTLAIIFFQMVGFSLVQPANVSLLSAMSHRDSMGRVMGASASAESFAQVVGPMVL